MSRTEDDDSKAIVHTEGQYAVRLQNNPDYGDVNVELAFRGGVGEPTAYIAYINVESAKTLVEKLQIALLRISLGDH